MPRQKRNRGEGKSASELSKEIMPLNGATKDELLGALRGDKRSHELVKEVVEQLISQRPFTSLADAILRTRGLAFVKVKKLVNAKFIISEEDDKSLKNLAKKMRNAKTNEERSFNTALQKRVTNVSDYATLATDLDAGRRTPKVVAAMLASAAQLNEDEERRCVAWLARKILNAKSNGESSAINQANTAAFDARCTEQRITNPPPTGQDLEDAIQTAREACVRVINRQMANGGLGYLLNAKIERLGNIPTDEDGNYVEGGLIEGEPYGGLTTNEGYRWCVQTNSNDSVISKPDGTSFRQQQHKQQQQHRHQ